MAKKSAGRGGNNLVQEAVNEGIEAIVKEHPRFREFRGYIGEHIDKGKLQARIRHISQYINKKGETLGEKEKSELFYKELASYVASGEVFDEQAQEVILKKSLGEKNNQRGRSELEGVKYLDKVGSAFRDLYSLMSSGDYAQRMPEVAKAVATIKDLGFIDSALDVLKSYDLLDDRKYNEIKRGIYKRVEEEQHRFGEGIGKVIYAKPKKVAAIIFGIIGIFIILANGIGITGGVIGGFDNASSSGILGSVLLILSILLFLAKGKK